MDRRSDEEKATAPAGAARALRYRTLCRLEEVLRLLATRHGARMTLGELFAVTAGTARLCRHDQVSIAEIADATGSWPACSARTRTDRMHAAILH